jgi:hypothetical protein
MIIQLSSGQHELLEREDTGRLKLRVPSGWSAEDIARGLPFEATRCTTEHVWLRQHDLRALARFETAAPDPISLMVEKAKTYGFYDEASDAIRIHVEYY